MRARSLISIIAVTVASAAPVVVASGPGHGEADVPAAALEALQQGRHWRASLILAEYLAEHRDASPETVLLAAEAAAGWGDWASVAELLDGQGWLGTVGGGRGWWLLGRSRAHHGDWPGAETAFQRYLDVAKRPSARDRGLTRLWQAQAATRAGASARALDAYAAAAADLPQLRDWIRLFAARASAEAGDTVAVERQLSLAGDRLTREQGWRIRSRGWLVAGDTVGALDVLQAATRTAQGAEDRAAAWAQLGRVWLDRADTLAARDALGRAMGVASRSEAAIDAARRLSELPLDPEESLAVGRLYLRHGNLERAIEGLGAYLASGDGSARERTRAAMEHADALFRAGRFTAAERGALAVAEVDGVSPRTAAEALLLAGRAQYRAGRVSNGMATFRTVVDRFPDQDAAVRAAFLLADLNHDTGRLDEARAQYVQVVELAPDANESGLAQMRLGGMALLAGDAGLAADLFEQYRSRYPDGRRVAQATYWAGRAYEAAGDGERARDRYAEVARLDPMGYYGIAGARRVARTVPKMELEPAPAVSPAAEARAAALLERIDLLDAVGADGAVSREIDRARRELGVGGGLYPLAEGLNARGHTSVGITIGWRILEREGTWNQRLLRIVYPFPYRDMVVAEAEGRGVDPFLVAGLIRRESAFDPAAVSGAGAVGLMQVMPATGRAEARRAGVGRFQPSMLHDVELNLHLGMAYLDRLLERYGGRVADVLIAYNAGPARLNRWRELPEYEADAELFVERIPYSETREYVRFVQEHASIYAALYGTAVTRQAEE